MHPTRAGGETAGCRTRTLCWAGSRSPPSDVVEVQGCEQQEPWKDGTARAMNFSRLRSKSACYPELHYCQQELMFYLSLALFLFCFLFCCNNEKGCIKWSCSGAFPEVSGRQPAG